MKSNSQIKWRQLAGLLLLASCACLLISCASMDVHSTQYVGGPRYSPTSAANIEILRSEPARPHERLGEIMVDSSTNPEPAVTKIEEKIRAEAAKMGAEAVVVVFDQVQPVGAYVTGGWWSRSVQTVTGHRLVGVAIKYK